MEAGFELSKTVENCLDFGGPWLGLELITQLGLAELFNQLMDGGREDVPWSLMAMVLVIAWLVQPAGQTD